MKRSYWIAAVLMCMGAGVALLAPSVHSQEASVFEVLIPAEGLEVATGDGRTMGAALDTITAYADDEECASVDVSSPTSDVVLQLGLTGQPAACSREGAFVTFTEGRGFWLATSMTLRKGDRETLTNFAPVPPGAPRPSPTFHVVISGEGLTQRLADGTTMAAELGTITVYVDGQECMTADISSASNDQILLLGPEQPDACSREGGIVTFRTGRGQWLNAWFTWQRSARVTLTNFAPTPTCSPGPCPTPGPSPTPVPEAAGGVGSGAASGTGGIAPPSVGDAGLLP